PPLGGCYFLCCCAGSSPPMRPLQKSEVSAATCSRRSGVRSPPLSPKSAPSASTPLVRNHVPLPRSSASWQRRLPCCRYVSRQCCPRDQRCWQSFKPRKLRGEQAP